MLLVLSAKGASSESLGQRPRKAVSINS